MKDSTRRTIRTAFAVIAALAAAAPVLVHEAGLDPEDWPWLATVLAVAAAVTRIMASQVVEDFLARFVPWLSASAGPPGRHEAGGDTGSAGVRLLLASSFAVLLVGVTAATAQAHWPHDSGRPGVSASASFPAAPPKRDHRRFVEIGQPYQAPTPDRGTTPYVEIGSPEGNGGAFDCDGVLLVSFTAKNVVNGEWLPVHDRAITFQLYERSGRAHPPEEDGGWLPISWYGQGDVQSAADSQIRWPGLRVAQQNGAVVDKVRAIRAGIASTPAVIREGCPS